MTNRPPAQSLQAAMTHHQAGRLTDALACYDEVLAVEPDSAVALYNRSLILHALERFEEALASFDRVLALQPDDAGALRGRGLVLQALARHEAALESFEAALALAPGDAEEWTTRGSLLHALGRFDEALASHERALALNPEEPLAQWNESLCRLAMGDYARGWKQYEWRWKWSGFTSPKLNIPLPLWLGAEDLRGKTILLHAEQGLGDTIQFARYVPLVAAKGAEVVLLAQKILVPLMQGLTGPKRVVGPGDPMPRADYYSPLLSLPLAFSTTLETIPATVPYLYFEPASAPAWRRKLAGKGERLIGVCWRGSAGYKGDRERSIPFAKFAPLLEAPGVTGVRFVGLQKELNAEESAQLAQRPDFINPAENFTDTAEIVAALDLVITVDTAWAHVAGAVGAPVWVLLPHVGHWCWLRDRRDSPWYPTARLFRQPARGDWDSVIEQAMRELSNEFTNRN